MRKGTLAGIVVVLLAGLLIAAFPGLGFATAGHNGRVLTAELTGAEEVPGPGDPDGSGRARVALKKHEVCFLLKWDGIEPPNSAHIHRGPTGVAGPVVVELFGQVNPLPASITMVGGCVRAPSDLIREIRNTPAEFYINVHNPEFPDGAIRGQLHR